MLGSGISLSVFTWPCRFNQLHPGGLPGLPKSCLSSLPFVSPGKEPDVGKEGKERREPAPKQDTPSRGASSRMAC